jgi:N-acetylneuraminic acid mutarotase
MRRRDLVGMLPLAAYGKTLEWRERAPMPVPRAGLIAGVFRGRMVMAGGSDWQGEKKVLYARTDSFDPVTNQWHSGPDLPAPRCDAPTVVLQNGMYAFGGVVGGAMTASVLHYDGLKWREAPELALGAPTMYAMAAVSRQDVYLFGGLGKLTDLTTAGVRLRKWRSDKDKGWEEMAAFPGKSRVTAALVLVGSKLFLFGGAHQPVGGVLENLNEVWSYDLSADRWNREKDLPVVMRAWSAVAMGNEVLLLGGYRETFESGVFVYDVKSGESRDAGKLPYPLADVRFLRMGKRLLNAGGETGFHIRAPWTLEAQLQ